VWVSDWRFQVNFATVVRMTTAQAQIFEMFQSLPLDDRRDLLVRLSEAVDVEDPADDLSAEDIAAIEEGLAQAERGEVVDVNEAMDRLAARFQFSRA
jgi:hypothetical protein